MGVKEMNKDKDILMIIRCNNEGVIVEDNDGRPIFIGLEELINKFRLIEVKKEGIEND